MHRNWHGISGFARDFLMVIDIDNVQNYYFCTFRALAGNMSSSTYPHVLFQTLLCPPWHTEAGILFES